jgi:dTDP-4-dehydrorhamnose reductase
MTAPSAAGGRPAGAQVLPGAVSWLVTGAGGQLGIDLQAALAAIRPGDPVTALGRDRFDLTDEIQVRSAVRRWCAAAVTDGRRPVVLNAAAYTAVDAAETDEGTALVVNGDAPGWLAEELAGRGRLVHVSTDYVFDGTATAPYRVDAATAPRSAYGRTKLAGERAVAAVDGDAVVVRTAWVYAAHGTNFVRTMLRLEAERDTVSVVADQTGTPTWSADLARGLVAAALSSARGLLHATNAGATTWHGLARLVFALSGAEPERVLPTTTDAFPRPAHRPAYSVLDPASWTAAGLAALPPWEDSVRACLAQLGALRSP